MVSTPHSIPSVIKLSRHISVRTHVSLIRFY